jgi:type II secretion system protein H
MNRRRAQFGFTLLELILVMAILAIVLALAAPKLQGWREGGKLRNSADDFVTSTKYARSQAAASGYVCVVAIDRQSGTYVVKQQSGQNFNNVDGEFGQPMSILEGGQIDAIDSGKSAIDQIMFYPTGRVQPASVRITAKDGESVTITCTTPAEDFAIQGAS